jgi:hypothetical protein
MEYNVSWTVNLDKRDSEGKPTVTKTPKHFITVSSTDDKVSFSISVIENGSERVVYTSRLWHESVEVDCEALERELRR